MQAGAAMVNVNVILTTVGIETAETAGSSSGVAHAVHQNTAVVINGINNRNEVHT